MSNPKFTPGPWNIAYGDFFHTVFADGDEDEVKELFETFATEEPNTTSEESVANLNLVASAPNMYDKLVEIINYLDEKESINEIEQSLLDSSIKLIEEIDGN